MIGYSGPGYAGPGFIGLIECCFRLATARYPQRWEEASISAREKHVWNAIGSSLEPELLWSHLNFLVPKPRDEEALLQRYADFEEARSQLRDALVSMRIVAGYRDDAGSLVDIAPAETWASDVGLEALRRGTARIGEGPQDVCRFLIVREDQLVKLASPGESLPDGEARKVRRGRPSSHPVDDVRAIVFELMEYHSEFMPGDPSWDAQARLENAVRDKLKSDLSESRLREIIVPHLEEWRQKRSAGQ